MFDLEEIKKWRNIVNIFVGIAVIPTVLTIINSTSDVLIVLTLFTKVILLITWCILWGKLKKNPASIIVHAVILAPLLYFLAPVGIVMTAYIATSQANTVLKYEGDVIVTFGNIKPRQNTEK